MWGTPDTCSNTHTIRTCASVHTWVCMCVCSVPLKEPAWVHQDADVFNASVVGVMEAFGQVMFQIRRDLLFRPFTLNSRHWHKYNTHVTLWNCCVQLILTQRVLLIMLWHWTKIYWHSIKQLPKKLSHFFAHVLDSIQTTQCVFSAARFTWVDMSVVMSWHFNMFLTHDLIGWTIISTLNINHHSLCVTQCHFTFIPTALFTVQNKSKQLCRTTQ